MKTRQFILMLLLLVSITGLSQSRYPLNVMIGFPISNSMDNLRYRPHTLIIQVPFLLGKSQGSFLTINPSASLVSILQEDIAAKYNVRRVLSQEFEAALSFGFKQLFRINYFSMHLEPYLGVASISYSDHLQSGGFNFILGGDVGVAYEFGELDLNLHFRYRHVSNAEMRQPNNGINNLMFFIGFTRSRF